LNNFVDRISFKWYFKKGDDLILENLVKLFELVASRINFFSTIYFRLFGYRVFQEVKALRISKNDKVLQIGSGALPYTAEIIAKLTGAKVVAIDNDYLMVVGAREYLKKKGVKNVKVLFGDGVNFPLENFTVIYIALGVYPLEQILKRIIKEGEGKRVIFRTPIHPLARAYNRSARIHVEEKYLGGRLRKSKILIL
jgi:protein-L-isoaspartate O-methyltransferase